MQNDLLLFLVSILALKIDPQKEQECSLDGCAL
jgi:hypothetical protein